MCVEVNGCVNYPIKSCLIGMEERGEIDMDCPYHKLCVSWYTIRVANVGTTLAVQSWNQHPNPGNVISYLDCCIYLHV